MKLPLAIAASVALFAPVALAQRTPIGSDPMPVFEQTKPLIQNFEFRPDKLGNCKAQITMSLNATEWENWTRSSFAKWPSLWKRDLIRLMSGMDIKPEDIKITSDNDNRKVTVDINARGIARPRPGGRFELNLSDLNNLTDKRDREFLFIENKTDGVMKFQQQMRVFVPAEATDVRLDKGENNVGYSITYALPGVDQPKTWLIGSAAFGAGALLLIAAKLAGGKGPRGGAASLKLTDSTPVSKAG